jgi:rubrerythrin
LPADQNLIKIFEYALSQEETGKSFFQASLARMGWGAAVTAFKRVLEEEEKHILFINNILRGLKQGGPEQIKLEKDIALPQTNFFDERSRREFSQQVLLESMVPDVTVFSMAWLIEKDLSEFYEKMAGQTAGKAQEALSMLAGWERGHERFFREFREQLTKVYDTMPWGG